MLDERRFMDGEDRRVVMDLRGDYLSPGRAERLEHHPGTLGHLCPGLPHAEPDLPVRLVEQTVLVPDDREPRYYVMISL
jgi:hypothetical protein